MPTKPKLADCDAAGDDLESSLNAIKDVADTFAALQDGTPSQGRAFQLDAMRSMDDAIEDGVGEGGIADHLVPAAWRSAGSSISISI